VAFHCGLPPQWQCPEPLLPVQRAPEPGGHPCSCSTACLTLSACWAAGRWLAASPRTGWDLLGPRCPPCTGHTPILAWTSLTSQSTQVNQFTVHVFRTHQVSQRTLSGKKDTLSTECYSSTAAFLEHVHVQHGACAAFTCPVSSKVTPLSGPAATSLRSGRLDVAELLL